MNLLKTSYWSLLSTGIKLLSGLIINEAVSVFYGPSGLAVIGQLQNLISISQTVSSCGAYSGITKYTSEYSEDKKKLQNFFLSCSALLVSMSFLTGIILILFSENISKYLFNSEEYHFVVIFLGFSIPLFTLNQFLLSVINGLRETRVYFKLNIFQSIYGVIYTATLIYLFELNGALIAISTNQAVIFFNALYWFVKINRIKIELSKLKLESSFFKKMFNYSIMSLVAACCYPLVFISLRGYIEERSSWEAVGAWQAMLYISTLYLMVISTVLNTYFLPVFSKIKDNNILRNELYNGLKVIVPSVVLMSCVIYFSKYYIVSLLFTSEFSLMLPLFKWQLVGDIFKIISYIFIYFIIAKTMVKEYILVELIGSFFYWCMSMFLFDKFGLIGMSYAHAINYLICLIVVSTIVIRRVKLQC